MPVKVDINRVDVGVNFGLPSNRVVWTSAKNVRFRPGIVRKAPGKYLLNTVPGNLPVRAIFPYIGVDRVLRAIVCCDTQIFSYDSGFGTATNITPSPAPVGIASDVWQFEIIGGMPVISNGADFAWKQTAPNTPLVRLSGVKGVYRVLGSAHNRLFVSDQSAKDRSNNEPSGAGTGEERRSSISCSDVFNPEMWTQDLEMRSDRQDITSSLPRFSALEFPRQFVTDGDTLLLFTNQNVWRISEGNTQYLFSAKVAYQGIGTPSNRAVCQARTGRPIYIFGEDEIYSLTNQLRPIGFNIKDDLLNRLNLNSGQAASIFTYYDETRLEAHFCVPVDNSSTPNLDYVYQEETKSWTLRDCDFNCIAAMKYGEQFIYTVVGDSNGQILGIDDFTFNKADETSLSFVLESGDIGGRNEQAGKIVHAVAPVFESKEKPHPIFIQVGTKDKLSDSLSWSNRKPFMIGVDKIVKFSKRGSYFRVKFSSEMLDTDFSMTGFSVYYSEEDYRAGNGMKTGVPIGFNIGLPTAGGGGV